MGAGSAFGEPVEEDLVDLGGLFEVEEVSGAGDADEGSAGEAAFHALFGEVLAGGGSDLEEGEVVGVVGPRGGVGHAEHGASRGSGGSAEHDFLDESAGFRGGGLGEHAADHLLAVGEGVGALEAGGVSRKGGGFGLAGVHGVHGDDGGDLFGVKAGEFEHDHAAHGVAGEGGAGNAGGAHDGFDGTGEALHGVVGGGVAFAVAGEVEGDDAVAAGEGFDLGFPEGMIAGPAVDEDDRFGAFSGSHVVDFAAVESGGGGGEGQGEEEKKKEAAHGEIVSRRAGRASVVSPAPRSAAPFHRARQDIEGPRRIWLFREIVGFPDWVRHFGGLSGGLGPDFRAGGGLKFVARRAKEAGRSGNLRTGARARVRLTSAGRRRGTGATVPGWFSVKWDVVGNGGLRWRGAG